MVLQNKYKAKASRRYNSSKGPTEDADPGSSKPGYRHRFAKKHGQPSHSQAQNASDSRSGGEDEEDELQSGSEEGEGNSEFPSLAKAASASTTGGTANREEEEDPSNPNRGKYARRRLGESKLARLERLEAAKDPRLPDDEEPEPEVDISNLVARVAALGDSAGTQAGLAEEIARSRGQNETASDVENDIDHSLAYLHEKERQRQKAKGRGGAAPSPSENAKNPIEALDVDDAMHLEALKKEKEKAEAVRALKARFQGHAVGERSRSDGKPRAAPSIKIGPSIITSEETVEDDEGGNVVSSTGTLSDSLTAEIESSLAKSRNRALSGETGSINSGRSSFSTTFGRRRSPLAGVQVAEPERGSGPRTERIDSFLASLNDRSIQGRDPSVFSLSPAGSNTGYRPNSHRTSNRMDQALPTQPIHSAPGELNRLENFLDDMLG